MEWFKFYNNKWLGDRAIVSLSPQDRLCFITLLCVTSQSDERNGVVTHYDEEAILRLTQLPVDVYDDDKSDYHLAMGFTKRLLNLGLIERINDTTICIKNFEKRQSTNLSGAERAKKHRDKVKSDERNTKVTKKSDERTAREDKIRVDKNRTTTKANALEKYNKLGTEIIKMLEKIDPKNKAYYNNTSQRKACDFLIEEYGLNEVLKRISVLSRTNKIPYFPTITTPVQLRDKWVQLQDAVERKRGESKEKSNVAFT